MPTEKVDVVVIGSGYGGSVVAARLAEAGMKVVVLERGARKGAADFRQSDDLSYIQSIVDVVVSKTGVAFRTGKLVGGASIAMDGAHYRMPEKSFEAKDAKGRRYWPPWYSRASMDPYYERGEKMLEVRQFGWDEIPKAGGLFAKMLDAAGASCDRARLNYVGCLHCGFCSQGCIFEKKRSLLYNYLPLAEKAGAQVRADAAADHVEPSGTGWLVAYRAGGQPAEIVGQRVVVACGGIHSPVLLLRSKKWLPALSPHTGENFNNNGEHAFLGILPPDFDDLASYSVYKGSENAAMMTFHWFESEGFTLHPGGGMEPSVLAASIAKEGGTFVPARAWGMPYKRFAEQAYPHRIIGFSALGLADGHRAIVLDDQGAPDVVDRDRATYDAYLDRLEDIVFAVGKKTGVELLTPTPRKLAGTTSAHLLSACRMAEKAADGVVDPDGQVFGHENLYLCDASTVPYALGVNPALTVTALAERTAERIAEKG